jgi:uncharacterized protein YjdB
VRLPNAIVAVLLSIATIAGCGEEPSAPAPPPVFSVEVSPEELFLEVGATARLDADVELGSAGDSSVTWTSTSDSVATVDSTGIVEGVSEGTTTVFAAADADSSVRDSASVSVENVCTPIGFDFTVSPQDTSIAAGDSIRYSTTKDSVPHPSEWSSTDTTVATIDTAGLATGVAAGTTSIVLRAERPEGWCGSEFESDTASLDVSG